MNMENKEVLAKGFRCLSDDEIFVVLKHLNLLMSVVKKIPASQLDTVLSSLLETGELKKVDLPTPGELSRLFK